MKYFKVTLLIINVLFISCSEENEGGLNNIPQADFSYIDDIDRFDLVNNSTDPDGDLLTYRWSSNSAQIKLSRNTSKEPYFKLPDITEPSEITIRLIVSDGIDSATVSKVIPLPALTETRKVGLGHEVNQWQSNNVGYNWYIDQMNTGAYAKDNCGPATATMAIKWFNETFDKTTIDARNTYNPNGGWWYTDDIINYLNLYSVNNIIIKLTSTDLLVSELGKGNIIIICLDMYYVTDEEKSGWHVDKFYKTSNKGWGHFIIIKGYKTVDNNNYFEVYDPYCFGKRYSNSVLKGIDRYYRASDINKATNFWWDNAIIISRSPFLKSVGVDINSIEHKYGI